MGIFPVKFSKASAFVDVCVQKLTKNMRVEALGAGSAAGKELQEFSQWLLQIGEGRSGEKVGLPEDIVMDFEDEKAMMQEIFPDLTDGAACLSSCILMPLMQNNFHV